MDFYYSQPLLNQNMNFFDKHCKRSRSEYTTKQTCFDQKVDLILVLVLVLVLRFAF